MDQCVMMLQNIRMGVSLAVVALRKLAICFPLAVATWSVSACQVGAASAPHTVSLRVQGNVPDAQVTIDDQAVGVLAFVASRGVALPPGRHRITVEKAGYFPWDALVEATREPVHLQIALVPIPD
jgi:hypothetical protein